MRREAKLRSVIIDQPPSLYGPKSPDSPFLQLGQSSVGVLAVQEHLLVSW